MYLLTFGTGSTAAAFDELVKHSNKLTSADHEDMKWRHLSTAFNCRTIGKVLSNEKGDPMETFDIEIDGEPWYYAGAVRSHNTTSKLFLLTEGWHLASMAEFLRWVQFRNDDPLVVIYRDLGYPTRELVSYSGTTIVGFPTAPAITLLGMGDKLVTAGNATPEEQFQWLMLGEKYWIHGTDENGVPVKESYGGQVSYTLKYLPAVVEFEHFKKMILKYQSQVRCCSVMPQTDTSASTYEYLPEEPITHQEFLRLKDVIASLAAPSAVVTEEIGREHVGCDNGACPVDFNSASKG
jgi:hypothetical protein